MAYCVKYVFSSLFEQKEKARFQAQEDAERQRQDRELQTQQEEEERQLRKKVILKRKTDKENMRADCLLQVWCTLNWGKVILWLNVDVFLQRIEEIMKRTRKVEADLKVL